MSKHFKMIGRDIWISNDAIKIIWPVSIILAFWAGWTIGVGK